MTSEEFAAFVSEARWQFAKTMPKNPHAYTLRKWHSTEAFEAACDFVVGAGSPMQFGRRLYTVYVLGAHRYWTMGEATEDTELLNRALQPDVQSDDLLDTDGLHAQFMAEGKAPRTARPQNAAPRREVPQRPPVPVRKTVETVTDADGIPTFTTAAE